MAHKYCYRHLSPRTAAAGGEEKTAATGLRSRRGLNALRTLGGTAPQITVGFGNDSGS